MAGLTFASMDTVRPINSETYTTQTYNFLRSAIFRRELKEGEVYSQDQISTMLNISRTPVREALLALQKEGYIRFLRGRGFEIVPYDEKDISNISEMRLIIEKAAAALAAQRATPAQIAAMEKNIQEQQTCVETGESFDVYLYLQLDDTFHKQILEASRNKYLAKASEDMRNQWMRSGYSILQSGENKFDSCREHQAVLEAIQTGDSAAAERQMALHINNTQFRRLATENDVLG